MLIYVLYFLSLHYSCLDMDSVGSFQRLNKEHRIKWVIICKVFHFYLLNIVVYTYSLQLTDLYTYSLQLTDVYTLQSNTAYRFVHFTVYSLLCTLYSLIHLTDLYTLQFTAYRCVHFTVYYSFQMCTLYSLLQLSDVYTLQSTTAYRCVHFTVYSLQMCTLYILLQLSDVHTL